MNFLQFFWVAALLFFFAADPADATAPLHAPEPAVPVYLYHRFGHEIKDSMTVSAVRFESQLKKFREENRPVIPLRRLVDFLLGKTDALPPGAVVLTADDGHRSVYTEMFPLLKKYGVPAALFLYPSALSRASYALTWGELREMKESGLLDYQGHTYWHPNFKTEKRRLPPEEYRQFVRAQLKRGKERLEKEFQSRVDLLAWPFGIYDEELGALAKEAGYAAAFTMERRPVGRSENPMALPRFLVADPMVKIRK